MSIYLSIGVYLLPYVFFKTLNVNAAAVEKPSKLEKLNFESIHHRPHPLSVIQSRDAVSSENSSSSTGSGKLSAIGTEESVFRPDDLGTVHRPDLYIEDFFARDLVTRPHPNLTKLIMVMSTPGTSPNPSNRSIEHFYARAAKNLKRAVPDLQVLVLRGGYRFYPQTKGQPDTFANEIRRLRKSMDTLTAVCKAIGLREVQFDPLRIEFVHDKNQQRQVRSSIIQALMDSFDVRKLELTERHSIITNYQWISSTHVGQLRVVLLAQHKEGYSRDLDTDLF